MRYYNVQDYGPLDTPVNTTAAIHAAIAAANANGGGRVYFPSGVYEHLGVVCRNRNILLQGEFNGGYVFGELPGVPAGTVLKYVGPTGGIAVDFGPDPDVIPRIYGGGIKDLVIDGNNLASSVLRIRAVYNAEFANLSIWHGTFAGLHLQTSIRDHKYQNYRNTFYRVYVKSTGSAHGILINGICAFAVFVACHVTCGNGISYHWNDIDDGLALGCATSLLQGATPPAGLYFGADSTVEPKKAAVGNIFLGFLVNGGVGVPAPIVAQGGSFPSRSNLVIVTSVDGRMPVYKNAGAKLFVIDVGGYAPLEGYCNLPPITTVY